MLWCDDTYKMNIFPNFVTDCYKYMIYVKFNKCLPIEKLIGMYIKGIFNRVYKIAKDFARFSIQLRPRNK